MKPATSQEPDPRWRDLVSDKSELIALVNRWAVGPWVPESIADVLRVSRSLLVDSYVTYEYSLVAITWSLLVVEASLKGCLPIDEDREDRRTFGRLVAEALRRGLITQEERTALNKAAALRNRLVHGYMQLKPSSESYSPQSAATMLESIHNAISDLFERSGKGGLHLQ